MSKTKILVADDDRITLSVMAVGLKKAGFDVVRAMNGEDAVRLGCKERVDLAILDVRMPGIFGIEAARQLRHEADIDCIFLSAYADVELVELAIKEGALGYLVKPVNSTQLIPAVKAALERSAELRRLHETEASLTHALETNREISVAVGIYMERFDMEREDAVKALRAIARPQRRKLVDVAHELIQTSREKS
jgi:response regulator NasT